MSERLPVAVADECKNLQALFDAFVFASGLPGDRGTFKLFIDKLRCPTSRALVFSVHEHATLMLEGIGKAGEGFALFVEGISDALDAAYRYMVTMSKFAVQDIPEAWIEYAERMLERSNELLWKVINLMARHLGRRAALALFADVRSCLALLDGELLSLRGIRGSSPARNIH